MKRIVTLKFLFLSSFVSYELLMKHQQQTLCNVVVAFTPLMMKPTTTRTRSKTTRTTTFTPYITTIPKGQHFDSSKNLLLRTATTLDASETLQDDENQHVFDDAVMTESKTGSNMPPSIKQPKPILMQKMQDMMMMMMKSTTNELFLHGDDGDGAHAWEKKVSWITSIVLAMTLMMATTFSSPDMAMAAVSGGRMGGSFSPSTSSTTRSSSSSYRPSSSYSGGRARRFSSISPSYYNYDYGGGGGRTIITSPTIIPSPVPYYATPTPTVYYQKDYSADSLGFFAAMIIVSVQFVVDKVRSIWNPDDEMTLTSSSGSSALGTGTSVIQLSVALQVSDRRDRNSILNVLNRLSETSKTDTRVGIQQLTKEVALQILRQKSTILSAYTRYKHFDQFKHAERDYNQLSVRERAKFEQETINKFGGVDYNSGNNNNKMIRKENPNPTTAVVTILLALEGDSTKIPKISSIRDVQKSLQMIASDAMVEDCLLNAEILWTPEDYEETLTVQDVITDYPELTLV